MAGYCELQGDLGADDVANEGAIWLNTNGRIAAKRCAYFVPASDVARSSASKSVDIRMRSGRSRMRKNQTPGKFHRRF
jgi:hypothetical protein